MSANMDDRFSRPFEATPEYLETLLSMCHGEETLRGRRYQLEASPSGRIEEKLRCTKCVVRIQRPVVASELPPLQSDPKTLNALTGDDWNEWITAESTGPDSTLPDSTSTDSTMPDSTSTDSTTPDSTTSDWDFSEQTAPIAEKDLKFPVCFYHVGRIARSKKSNKCEWTCCEKPVGTQGCVEKYEHTIPPPDDPALSDYWRFYDTPEAAIPVPKLTKKGRKQKKFISLTEFESQNEYYRKAVAVDCEMGTSSTKWPELIRITVVDYFTGEALMNKLVEPSMPMRSLNTLYGSGVTWNDMRDAVRSGNYFAGAAAVRAQLFKYISPETIVVTHSGHNDLNVLRWIHPLVVDTQITHTSRQPIGLSYLSVALCGIGIQNDAKGHCSLEDALATREIMHKMVRDRMENHSEVAPIMHTLTMDTVAEEEVVDDEVPPAMEEFEEVFDDDEMLDDDEMYDGMRIEF